MTTAERILTFVVRVVASSTGELRAVIERVSTGRKQQVHTGESIGLAIAAMALEEARRDREQVDPSAASE